MSKTHADSLRSETLKVFVSYSRADLDFVDRLHQALRSHNIEAFVDRSDIEKLVDWRARIEQLIAGADTVIFVLSPDSIASESCAEELGLAARLSKRFAPVVARDFGKAPVLEPISKINYIFFHGMDFDVALNQLVRALRADVDWIREHTRLAEAAGRWDRNGRPQVQLLRGIEADRARDWLARAPRDAPAPTDQHRNFIDQSVKERERLRRSEWEKVSALSEKIELHIRNAQFRLARDVLDEAIEYCAQITEAELVAHAGGFRSRRQRIDGFVRFYERAREVYIFAGEEEFDKAREACEEALDSIGALHDTTWWRHLSEKDLTPKEIVRLKFEAHRQLLLLSGLRLQPGIEKISPKTKPSFDPTIILRIVPGFMMRAFAKAGGLSLLPALRRQDNAMAASDFRNALATLDRVQDFEVTIAESEKETFPPTRTGEFLRKIGELLLRLASGPKGEKLEYRTLLRNNTASPVAGKIGNLNSADYYFLGLLNFFVAKRRDSPFSKILSLFEQAFPDLDMNTPFDTAERLLRTGVSREPENFWPHFVLGRTLLSRGDYQGAELAFNVCISIDPTYARGFEQRALSLAGQWKQKRFAELRQRAVDDSRLALELAGDDPSTYWPRGELLQTLGQMRDAIDAYSRWMELENNLLGRMSRGSGLKKAHDFAAMLLRKGAGPEDQGLRADCYGLLALANWLWGHFTEAQQFADKALAAEAGQARARTVKGMLLRERRDLGGAITEFETAIRSDAASHLALLQRAETYEQMAEREKALDAWNDVWKASNGSPRLPAWMRDRASQAQKRLAAGAAHSGSSRFTKPGQVLPL